MLKAFLDYLAFERKLSKHTIQAYKTDIHQFELFCENLQVNDLLSVNSTIIRQWIIFLLEQNHQAVSVHRKISSIKAFYNFLQKQGKMPANPAEYVVLPKKQKRLPSFLKESETVNFFSDDFFPHNFEGTRDKCIIQLLYLTGIRRRELVDLMTNSIDFSRNLIIVKGKRNKTRMVPVPKWLLDQLDEYLSDRSQVAGQTHNALFVTEKGLPIYEKLVYRIVHKFLSQITTIDKKSPHVLRHTFASQMLDAGADLNAIKELLGHANLSATEIYTHNSFQRLKKVYSQAHPRA
ncbi:MAG: tyrosine-type recombinase/integrase [Salinivirgaceae bacterium]|jgi:integrase/recombinase XerC|nr:tyrosine-type recombinase/integrase [Salinivirgaceae bacterium]